MTTTESRPTVTDAAVNRVLRRVRLRLATPERWCRHARARAGVQPNAPSVLADNPDAVAWSIDGAVIAETRDLPELRDAVFIRLARFVPHRTGLVDWNDDAARRHHHILALIDRALEWTA